MHSKEVQRGLLAYQKQSQELLLELVTPGLHLQPDLYNLECRRENKILCKNFGQLPISLSEWSHFESWSSKTLLLEQKHLRMQATIQVRLGIIKS